MRSPQRFVPFFESDVVESNANGSGIGSRGRSLMDAAGVLASRLFAYDSRATPVFTEAYNSSSFRYRRHGKFMELLNLMRTASVLAGREQPPILERSSKLS